MSDWRWRQPVPLFSLLRRSCRGSWCRLSGKRLPLLHWQHWRYRAYSLRGTSLRRRVPGCGTVSYRVAQTSDSCIGRNRVCRKKSWYGRGRRMRTGWAGAYLASQVVPWQLRLQTAPSSEWLIADAPPLRSGWAEHQTTIWLRSPQNLYSSWKRSRLWFLLPFPSWDVSRLASLWRISAVPRCKCGTDLRRLSISLSRSGYPLLPLNTEKQQSVQSLPAESECDIVVPTD